MALVVKDRVKQITTTTGSGSIVLTSAVDGFQTFTSALTSGDTTYYAIVEPSTNAWEVGLGTWTESTTTLARTSILESSNSGSAINLTAGEAEVFITQPAEKAVFLDANGNISITGNVDGRDVSTDGAKLDGIEAGATADQSASEILTAVKTVDGSGSGLDADLLDGQHGSYYTNYTDTAVANIVDSAPGTLDTLNELAAALGDDANFSTTVTNSIATKMPLAGGTFTGDVAYGDNVKATFGASADLQVYHDGSNSRIQDTATGSLILAGTNFYVNNTGDSKSYIAGLNGGTTPYVRLYYDGATRLDTTSTGIDVTGNATFADNGKAIFGAGSDLQIYHTGTNSVIDNNTGHIYIRNNVDNDDGSNIYIQGKSGENSIVINDDSNVELYFDNAIKLATTSTGISVTGDATFADNGKAIFGAGSDLLQIYRNSSGSYVKESGSGSLYIQGTDVRIQNASGENILNGTSNGAVTLYYDNAAKIATTATGIDVTGNVTVSGNVDGRDVASDGTKLDGIEAGATIDQTPSELLTAIKTVDGSGSGLDADLLDGQQGSYYAVSTGSQSNDFNIRSVKLANLEKSNLTVDGQFGFDSSQGLLVFRTQQGVSGTTTVLDGANVAAGTGVTITNLGTGATGTESFIFSIGQAVGTSDSPTFAGINVTGTISADDLLNIESTTGYGRIEVGGPSGAFIDLKTPFSDDYDGRLYCDGNSLYLTTSSNIPVMLKHNGAVKLSTTSTGINVNGNITVTGTVDGRDVATDGSKLDGIESGATADQTAAQILTAIKTVDGSGSGLDADLLDGVQGSSYLRSDASDTFTTLSGTQLNLGSQVQLQESTDRADLLQITSSTSSWAGLQIRNSSNEGRWSFMTNGAESGFYDDENNEWAVQMVENGGVTLYHNGVVNFTTGPTYMEMGRHLDMNNNDIYGVDQIYHHADTNTYMQFHASDQWRVVTGGAERLEVNNSGVRINNAYTLPTVAGTNGYVLTTNGSGTASWAEASGGLDETTATTSSTSQTSIASYSTTTYGSAKLLVTAKRGTARQTSEILIVHDGTTAYATEYGVINTGSVLAGFDVDISGGNFRLLATATSATTTNYTVTEILVGA